VCEFFLNIHYVNKKLKSLKKTELNFLLIFQLLKTKKLFKINLDFFCEIINENTQKQTEKQQKLTSLDKN